MQGDVKREWFDTDYYQVLGVASSASADEITKAYRKLARKFHPDANPGDAAAEERFKEISAAYDVIGDDKLRSQYDQVRTLGPLGGAFGGAGHGSGPGGFDFEGMGDINDLLGSVLGGGLFGQSPRGGPRQARGRDQEARLVISFEEAVRGSTTSISVQDTSGPRSIRVRIPAGVTDGQRIRLRGKGGPGSPPGDLFVIVEVGAHPLFTRQGERLVLELPVTIAEAALGADVDVPTFEGSAVTVRVPAGTQPGAMLRVRGAGPVIDESAGDLFVKVTIAVPRRLSKAQTKALEAFAEADTESPRSHLQVSRS